MMMFLGKIDNLIAELNKTNSSNEKINILSEYKTDSDVCKFFNYVYNPFYMYGVTSKNLIKNNKLSELEFFSDIFELLDLLRTRSATGNKAISLVNGYNNPLISKHVNINAKP